jgi:hypothetical protein
MANPSLFSRISQGPKMFSKVINDPHLGRKLSNTSRKFDNTIQKVGNFIVNSGHEALGYTSGHQGLRDTIHNVRKHFQEAVHSNHSNKKGSDIEKQIKAEPVGQMSYV